MGPASPLTPPVLDRLPTTGRQEGAGDGGQVRRLRAQASDLRSRVSVLQAELGTERLRVAGTAHELHMARQPVANAPEYRRLSREMAAMREQAQVSERRMGRYEAQVADGLRAVERQQLEVAAAVSQLDECRRKLAVESGAHQKTHQKMRAAASEHDKEVAQWQTRMSKLRDQPTAALQRRVKQMEHSMASATASAKDAAEKAAGALVKSAAKVKSTNATCKQLRATLKGVKARAAEDSGAAAVARQLIDQQAPRKFLVMEMRVKQLEAENGDLLGRVRTFSALNMKEYRGVADVHSATVPVPNMVGVQGEELPGGSEYVVPCVDSNRGAQNECSEALLRSPERVHEAEMAALGLKHELRVRTLLAEVRLGNEEVLSSGAAMGAAQEGLAVSEAEVRRLGDCVSTLRQQVSSAEQAVELARKQKRVLEDTVLNGSQSSSECRNGGRRHSMCDGSDVWLDDVQLGQGGPNDSGNWELDYEGGKGVVRYVPETDDAISSAQAERERGLRQTCAARERELSATQELSDQRYQDGQDALRRAQEAEANGMVARAQVEQAAAALAEIELSYAASKAETGQAQRAGELEVNLGAQCTENKRLRENQTAGAAREMAASVRIEELLRLNGETHQELGQSNARVQELTTQFQSMRSACSPVALTHTQREYSDDGDAVQDAGALAALAAASEQRAQMRIEHLQQQLTNEQESRVAAGGRHEEMMAEAWQASEDALEAAESQQQRANLEHEQSMQGAMRTMVALRETHAGDKDAWQVEMDVTVAKLAEMSTSMSMLGGEMSMAERLAEAKREAGLAKFHRSTARIEACHKAHAVAKESVVYYEQLIAGVGKRAGLNVERMDVDEAVELTLTTDMTGSVQVNANLVMHRAKLAKAQSDAEGLDKNVLIVIAEEYCMGKSTGKSKGLLPIASIAAYKELGTKLCGDSNMALAAALESAIKRWMGECTLEIAELVPFLHLVIEGNLPRGTKLAPFTIGEDSELMAPYPTMFPVFDHKNKAFYRVLEGMNVQLARMTRRVLTWGYDETERFQIVAPKENGVMLLAVTITKHRNNTEDGNQKLKQVVWSTSPWFARGDICTAVTRFTELMRVLEQHRVPVSWTQAIKPIVVALRHRDPSLLKAMDPWTDFSHAKAEAAETSKLEGVECTKEDCATCVPALMEAILSAESELIKKPGPYVGAEILAAEAHHAVAMSACANLLLGSSVPVQVNCYVGQAWMRTSAAKVETPGTRQPKAKVPNVKALRASALKVSTDFKWGAGGPSNVGKPPNPGNAYRIDREHMKPENRHRAFSVEAKTGKVTAGPCMGVFHDGTPESRAQALKGVLVFPWVSNTVCNAVHAKKKDKLCNVILSYEARTAVLPLCIGCHAKAQQAGKIVISPKDGNTGKTTAVWETLAVASAQ